jgi:hypothetical protein
MTGRQVNFYLTPSDLLFWEKLIREKIPLCLLESTSTSSHPRRLLTAMVSEMGHTPLNIVICHPEQVRSVEMNHLERRGLWAVNIARSPAIELSRCYYDGKILRRGRLYYVPGYFEGDVWIEKDSSFVAWADRILNRTRRILKKQPYLGEYAGPEVLGWGAKAKEIGKAI